VDVPGEVTIHGWVGQEDLMPKTSVHLNLYYRETQLDVNDSTSLVSVPLSLSLPLLSYQLLVTCTDTTHGCVEVGLCV
jgi:hypothetical protein